MKLIRYFLASVLFISVVSCNDFFEIERPPQAPWTTIDEFERAPIGAYAGLFSGHEWNMAWVNERIVKSSMGDDIGFVSDPTYGYNRNSKEFNVYMERNFVQLYRVIATVNNALEFAEESNGDPYPSLSADEKTNNVNRIIGELHFIRAYAYYILQTTFGHAYVPGGANETIDIPMPTRYAKSAIEARNPTIGTTKQVYNLIVSDLRKAKALLPEKFDATKHHPSYAVRANKFAASGLLARTYMQKGVYDSAILECNFIIDQNNGAYDLTEDPIEAFNKSSLNRGREVIFYAPFFDDLLPAPNHISVINHTWDNSPTPWVETYMGFSTVTRFNWMNAPQSDTTININAKRDKRFSQLMKVRYPENRHTPTQAFDNRTAIRNFTTFFSNKYYRGAKNVRTNVPLIRLAEIYLTRSVLRLRAGDAAGAASDLNIVRARAWNAAVAGAAYVNVTAGSITESMINDERLIELFNEGDRIDYLRALKVAIPKGERGAGTDPYTSESFVWAIPALELNFNDAL
jgi:hypothetical protein